MEFIQGLAGKRAKDGSLQIMYTIRGESVSTLHFVMACRAFNADDRPCDCAPFDGGFYQKDMTEETLDHFAGHKGTSGYTYFCKEND